VADWVSRGPGVHGCGLRWSGAGRGFRGLARHGLWRRFADRGTSRPGGDDLSGWKAAGP